MAGTILWFVAAGTKRGLTEAEIIERRNKNDWSGVEAIVDDNNGSILPLSQVTNYRYSPELQALGATPTLALMAGGSMTTILALAAAYYFLIHKKGKRFRLA